MRVARRTRIGAVIAAALVACLIWAAAAYASDGTWERAWGKDVLTGGATGFEVCTVAANCKAGTLGGLGGELDTPSGVASDASGNVYVADTSNHRIQKFDSLGNFQRAWGRDVVTGGGTGLETCTVATNCKAGITGGLGGELDTPTSVAVDASGTVYVADFNNQRVQSFDSLGNFGRAWGGDVVTGGGTGFEVCTVAANCKQGVGGTLGGEMNSPNGVAVDGSANVYVADLFNNRLQRFDSLGNFQRAWGRDVVTGGGTGFEVCTVAANCKQGVAGTLGGEMSQPASVATDASANVYTVDGVNLRIQRFDALGTFQRAWGKDVVTGGGAGFEICTVAANCKTGVTGGLGGELANPAAVAADASGDVYVLESARIQSHDPLGNFQRAWGRDVVAGGTNGFEICTVAASCASGLNGTLGGELDSSNGGIASGPSGSLYVSDSNNQRVQRFGIAPPPPPPPGDGGGGGETPPEPPPDGTSDTAAPETTITKRPDNKTRRRKATFGFRSSEAASTFQCSLDGKPFTSCTSPKTVKVKLGKHSFKVRARDAAGNVDPKPAGDRWTRKPRR